MRCNKCGKELMDSYPAHCFAVHGGEVAFCAQCCPGFFAGIRCYNCEEAERDRLVKEVLADPMY